MAQEETIKLFDEKQVRFVWDDEQEKYYFSIVDVIRVLTDSANPQTYWRVLKKRLTDEGNETVTNCNALKLIAADGKQRLTDVADTEQLLRLIQSVPSKKAEPFKLWLAHVGQERLNQMPNVELALNTLAEASATELSQQRNPKGFSANAAIAKEGGDVARVARQQLEASLGQSVISGKRASDYLPSKNSPKELKNPEE